ncbi:hypothetical protein CROQUDRAFT_714425 [Cronartium quercuum f. sp. fusiforme G11]|uniref:Endonuclease/exonuclease/phosphatase domain-containing protein n=1 Tax=Cronartium quercuum f. sp. fusiforme G11 TaxID=708437 RepID=A0A9P6TFA2_9BASI|nr:hypothetical protein CROQUDRAFT_714425 [Cronartium quercuum f. sp. fusiforme G11]
MKEQKKMESAIEYANEEDKHGIESRSFGKVFTQRSEKVDQNTSPQWIPPSERKWLTVVPPGELPRTAGSKVEGVAVQETFKLISYNILHNRFVASAQYWHSPASTLDWDYRKTLILRELLQYEAEVICLQEVGTDAYEFFERSLGMIGYTGKLYLKSRARAKRKGAQKRVNADGCAIFFKLSIFELIEYHSVDFCDQSVVSDPIIAELARSRMVSRDNIALTAVLKHKCTGARQLVTNVHIHWDPLAIDVRIAQTAILTRKLKELSERVKDHHLDTHTPSRDAAPQYSDPSIIVCGDFNSRPDSGVYHYLSSGALDSDHNDYTSHKYWPFTASNIQHTLKLQSAYSHRGELRFTTYKSDYQATIDYIFYSPNSLAVTGVLGAVDRRDYANAIGFPNAQFPSDHVPILAEFQLKPAHLE